MNYPDEKKKKSMIEIAEEMRVFLAETYSLYLMTQNFHWNVTGPMFAALHTLFEKQYQELALAVDTIAERIRALGAFAPGSFREFFELSSLREETHVPEAEQIIQKLIESHAMVIQRANQIAAMCAEADDFATSDLMSERLMQHEKAVWMLQSILTPSHHTQL